VSVFLIPDGLAGERIDKAASRISGLSRNRIDQLLEAGTISLDGEQVSKSARVKPGQLLELTDLSERKVEVVPLVVDGMGIVYDDADVVVVDKPAGVAAHPSLGWEGPSVVEHLAGAGFRISTSGAPERQGIVQRLDVGTSGLMVVAKSEPAYTSLKQQFRDHTTLKIYHTLVQGLPDPHEGTIDAPIGRHPGYDYKMAVTAKGRPSVTHYETLEAHRRTTLLKVRLETGRTHQIRVHMQAIGHPVVGDPTYGSDPALADRLGLVRQWLHAVELGFNHPRSGEWLTFSSVYPRDLANALELVERNA
jgi:23S rRNA pseudouridine1911/1915/1917 synthase